MTDELYSDPDFLREAYWGRGQTISEIADDFEVSAPAIWYWMEKHGIERRSNEGPLVTDEQLLEDLRRVNEQVDSIVSQEQYQEFGQYALTTIRRRFESFTEALVDAGVIGPSDSDYRAIVKPYRDPAFLLQAYWGREQTVGDIAYVCGVTSKTIRNWMKEHNIPRRGQSDKIPVSDEEILEDLRRVNEQVDHTVSSLDYGELGKYSMVTVGRHFGSWTESLVAADIIESTDEPTDEPTDYQRL